MTGKPESHLSANEELLSALRAEQLLVRRNLVDSLERLEDAAAQLKAWAQGKTREQLPPGLSLVRRYAFDAELDVHALQQLARWLEK